MTNERSWPSTLEVTVGGFLSYLVWGLLIALPHISSEQLMNGWSFAGELAAAVFGTFVGAFSAFKLEERSRALELRKRRASDGNLALLTVFQMWNIQRQYQKEVINPRRGHPAAWFSMMATVPQSVGDLAFNSANLEFLFECEDKNLLPGLLLEWRRFTLAMELINRRSDLILRKAYPRLEAAGVRDGEQLEIGMIKAILGNSIAAEAEQLGIGIITNVDENVISLQKTYDSLRSGLREVLPGEKLITVAFNVSSTSETP
jgi:hypothetical protein